MTPDQAPSPAAALAARMRQAERQIERAVRDVYEAAGGCAKAISIDIVSTTQQDQATGTMQLGGVTVTIGVRL